MLYSISITQVKKEIFFVFFILLRRRYFVAKVIGMVIAFIELSRTYYKEIFLNFNSVKERNTRKLNNYNKEIKNNFFIAEVIELLNSDSITKENLRPWLKF